jgi:hypothetical protein
MDPFESKMTFERKASWILKSTRRIESTRNPEAIPDPERGILFLQEDQDKAVYRDMAVRQDDPF